MCCRHAGDLGNVVPVNGVVNITITDHLVTLFDDLGVSAIGRSFVVSGTIKYSISLDYSFFVLTRIEG